MNQGLRTTKKSVTKKTNDWTMVNVIRAPVIFHTRQSVTVRRMPATLRAIAEPAYLRNSPNPLSTAISSAFRANSVIVSPRSLRMKLYELVWNRKLLSGLAKSTSTATNPPNKGV